MCKQIKAILEVNGFCGDLERATVMFGADHDDERDFAGLAFAGDAEMMKFVIEHFASALPPVGQNAESRFEFEIDRVGDATVGTGAGDAEKVTSFFWLFKRSGEAESDVAHFTARKLFGGLGNIPGKFELLCENVRSSGRQESQRNAVAVLRIGEAVDDFVDGAIAAARNDELAAVGAGAPGNIGGFAGAGGFLQIGENAASLQDATG